MQTADLKAAALAFESEKRLIEKVDETDYNLYTEYKRGFPRFRFCSKSSFYVLLFSDQYCHLDPLHKSLVPHQGHHEATVYSQEILDSFSANQVATLPFPRFAPFFTGLCRTYIETKDAMAAIAAEALVDGMNLDEEWCKAYLPATHNDELNFALRLVRGKSSRIADFSPNEVTCFLADHEEAQRMLKIPGML